MSALLVLLSLLLCLPGLAGAATYYVSTSGLDTNTCSTAQSPGSSARRSIGKGIQCLAAGDTLIVQAGTYGECIQDYGTTRPPSGTSWSAPTIIKAQTALSVVLLHPNPKCAQSDGGTVEFGLAGTQYIVIDGFILDGSNFTLGTSSVSGIGADTPPGPMRFRNLEIRYMRTSINTLAFGWDYDNIEIHHNGIPNDTGCEMPLGCQGMYIRNQNNVFSRLKIHDVSGYAGQFSSAAGTPTFNNTFKNSEVYNTGRGIVSGGSLFFYNNVVYDTSNMGVKAGGGSSIIGNTIYSTTNEGIITLGTGNTVRNNIVLDSSTVNTECRDNAEEVISCAGNTVSTNLCNSTGNMCTTTGTPSATFASTTVGAGTYLQLKAGSPAVNAGATLSAPYDTDKVGNTHPAGAFDLGAYELVSGTPVPTSVAFQQQPSAAGVGVAITPAVTVRILDQFGALFSSTASVTVALGANPGGSTLSGTTTVNAVAGTATFSTLSLNQPGAGYTLVASSSGLTGATSSPFPITAPPVATSLAFGQQPTSTTSGVPLTPPVTVEVRDQFGALISSTASITVALGANPGGGTLSGTTTVSAVAGTATFATLSLTALGTGYTLVASSGLLTGATSGAFNIVALPKLSFGAARTGGHLLAR